MFGLSRFAHQKTATHIEAPIPMVCCRQFFGRPYELDNYSVCSKSQSPGVTLSLVLLIGLFSLFSGMLGAVYGPSKVHPAGIPGSPSICFYRSSRTNAFHVWFLCFVLLTGYTFRLRSLHSDICLQSIFIL